MAKKKNKSKKKAAGVLTKQEKELGWGGFDDKLSANKVPSTNPCRVMTIAHARMNLHHMFAAVLAAWMHT